MKSLNRIKNILDPKKIVINASVFTIISAITSSSALAITISGSFTGSRASYATGTRSYDIGFDGPISFCNASRQCIDVPFFVSSGTGNTIRVGYRNLVRTSFFSLSLTPKAPHHTCTQVGVGMDRRVAVGTEATNYTGAGKRAIKLLINSDFVIPRLVASCSNCLIS